MKAIIPFLCLFLCFSCEEKKKDSKRYLPDSSGNLNNISIVSDNSLWDGKVGSAIRNILAAPLVGLPQEEPTFNLKQIPTQVFDGFATKSRSILKIETGEENTIKILRDVYAKSQTVVLVKGVSNESIIKQLEENSAKIIDAFNKEEIKEKLRRINKSLLQDESMENKLGFTIDIPSVYKSVNVDDNFYWVRKSLSNDAKTMDLMFYSYPLDGIRKGDSTIIDIVKMRDSLIAKIPGEEGIVMTTEDAYVPALFKTIIDNKPTYETKGMWKIQNSYMAGPFVNYAIEDKINNRYLVAEGYVYAPSLQKREYVFELEAIIKSIKIK